MAAEQGGAIVTGGSSGIGLALASGLLGRGIPVMLLARDAARLEKARQELAARHAGTEILTAAADVTESAAVEAAVTRAVSSFGGLGWAVANAGMCEPGLFDRSGPETYRRHMETNFFGALHLARAAVPHLAQRRGRLVFVASGAALYGVYSYAAYGASKFAVRGLAETLRVELALDGISVTAAYPPDTDTPQFHAENEHKSAAARAITETSGVWTPAAVAGHILRAAERRRFSATPGTTLKFVELTHSFLAAAFRRRQLRIARKLDDPRSQADVRGRDQ